MLCIVCAVLAFVTCSKKGVEPDNPQPTPSEPTPTITIPATENVTPSFSDDGGAATVAFTTNANWSAKVVESGATWCTVSPASGGSGSHTLTINTSKNDTPDSRTATVQLIAGTVTKTINITQKQKDALTVTSAKFNVPAEGGNIDIEAKANVELSYTIEGDAKNWISYVETKALKTSHLIFKVSANENTEAREGKITVSGGGISETITVAQAAKVPAEFKISQTEVEVGSEKSTFEITITSSIGYQVKPEADWIKQTASSGEGGVYTHTFEVAENGSSDAREGIIVVCNDEQVCIPVKVKQAAKNTLLVTQTQYEVPQEGGSIDIEAKANVELTYTIEGEAKNWISHIETKALKTSHLIFKVSANENTEAREGKITVSGGGIDETITVSQAGVAPYINVPKTLYEVGVNGETIAVKVSSNVEVEVEMPSADWISNVTPQTTEEGLYFFEVKKNETSKARSCEITFKNSAKGVSSKVTVNQSAPAEFSISQSEIEVGSGKSTFEITITSSIGYQVKPEVDWIKQTSVTCNNGVYTHTFEVAENSSSDAREGIIVVCNDEQVCIPVKVKQAAKNTLLVTQTRYEVPQEGGSIDIEAKANVELTYTIEGEAKNWISHIETKALKTSHLIFKVSANENTEAREGKITVSGGGLSNEITVVQAAKVPAEFKISQTVVEVGAEKNSFEITITSSIGYEVKPEVDWVKQTSVTGSNGVYTHTFEVAENSSADAREGVIVVCNDEQVCIPVRVKQRGASNGSDAWVNKEFYHHSIAMRFTADWCGYCPNMATALAKAQKALPDKLEVLSVHADGGLYSSASATLCNFYGIGGFPTGVVDGRAVVENYDVSTIVSRVSSIVNETEAKYPTITGASWNSAISSNKVSLDLNVYLKKAGSYKVTALLVEDNIVAYQADYTNGSSNDYVHKDVVRAAFSNVLGDAVTIAEDGQIKSFNYSLDIPSGYNKNNLRIVVYVQAQDANGSYYINNASSAAVGKQQQLMVKSDNSGGVEGIVPGEDIPYNN